MKDLLGIGIEEHDDELKINVDGLDETDAEVSEQARIVLESIQLNHDVLVGVEAIETVLAGDQHPSKQALQMANMAYSLNAERASIDLQEMPIDINSYARTPEIVVEKSQQAINTDKASLLKTIQADMSKLLVVLAKHREHITVKLKAANARLTELESMLERGFQPDDKPRYLADLQNEDRLLQNGDLVASASTVCADVGHFLTEHSHMFKRITKVAADWLLDHKDNLLKQPNAFEYFQFDPDYYRCNAAVSCGVETDSDKRTADHSLVFKSKSLPGNKAMFFYTVDRKVFGDEALTALRSSCVEMKNSVESVATIADDYTFTMSADEAKARINETRRLMHELEHWSNVVHLQLWKEASFDDLLLVEFGKPTVVNILERQFGELAFAIISQLNQSSNYVGEYTTNVLESMIDYIEYGLKG